MTWFNNHQTKLERSNLIRDLLTDPRLNRSEKAHLRQIEKTDNEGHFHVDKYGNVKPSFSIGSKYIEPVRQEVVAPKHEVQGMLFPNHELTHPWEGSPSQR